MICLLDRLKTKRTEIKLSTNNLNNLDLKNKATNKNRKNVFSEVKTENNRITYHTKIFRDFYVFGKNKKEKEKFTIILRGVFNKEDKYSFNLFQIKENDEFIGIYYGYKKLPKPFIIKYEDINEELTKIVKIFKSYYIEFRYKKGSVFCYVRGLYLLLKRSKLQNRYMKVLLEIFIELEKQVFEFYGKKMPNRGVIKRWIEKNQK